MVISSSIILLSKYVNQMMAINFALTKLLDTLLMGCQEKDNNIRILCVENVLGN